MSRHRPDKFFIIDSTLREGEQHAGVRISPEQKLKIASALEDFGIEYIEVTSPIVSAGAFRECQMLKKGLSRSKVLAHVRCVTHDIDRAIEAGVDGLNLFMPSSPRLREASGLGSLMEAAERAKNCLAYARSNAPDIEIRISCEDAFRTPTEDIILFIEHVEATGVLNRIGLADTVGIATPFEVYDLVSAVREKTELDIEFHCHDDTGCAVANSLMALEGGCTHLDASVLGLGERNGITPLAGLAARIYTTYPGLLEQYRLDKMLNLHEVASCALGLEIPRDHYVVGSSAFNHKAGVHIGAICSDENSYEAIAPDRFGAKRNIELNTRLVGLRGIMQRAMDLGVSHNLAVARELTQKIKESADNCQFSAADIDDLIIEASGTKL